MTYTSIQEMFIMRLHFIYKELFRMNLQKEINEYLSHCKYQKKLSPLTLKAYEIDLKQLSHFCNTTHSHSLSKPTILSFIQELHQKYLPRTAKRKIASLRAFLNHLEFEEIIEANPMRRIKTKFQEPKQLPKTIPLRIIQQMLLTAHTEYTTAATPHNITTTLRDRAILETLFATGVRVSELCSLKKDDVNLEDGTIHIVGKGTKERIIQVENNDVIKSLRQYHTTNSGNSSFFLPIAWVSAIPNNPFVL